MLPNTVNISDSHKYTLNRNTDSRSNYGELTVHNVDYNDTGIYKCIVENYIGRLSASARLTVHGKTMNYSSNGFNYY